MTVTPLIIVGGGEHGRVVADAAASTARFTLVGFVDPHPADEGMSRWMIPHLGGDEVLRAHPDAMAVLGLGPKPHWTGPEDVVRRLTGVVRGWASVVHATAIVARDVVIGDGCVIMAGAVVQPGARLGRHTVINTGAVVEHDAVVGDFVHVAPAAALGGGVRVGQGSYVGMGAVVRDHVEIGTGAVVGMGSVVVSSVDSGMEVRGVPARGVAAKRRREGK